MPKSFWANLLSILNDNIESITVVNKDGKPQVVVTPKNTAKEILDAVSKDRKNGEATQEG